MIAYFYILNGFGELACGELHLKLQGFGEYKF
jgi:hypothetical protein